MKDFIIANLDLLSSYELEKLEKSLLVKKFEKTFNIRVELNDNLMNDFQVALGDRHYWILSENKKWNYEDICKEYEEKLHLLGIDNNIVKTIQYFENFFASVYYKDIRVEKNKLIFEKTNCFSYKDIISFCLYLKDNKLTDYKDIPYIKNDGIYTVDNLQVKIYKNKKVEVSNFTDIEIVKNRLDDFTRTVEKVWNNSTWYTWKK